MGKWNNFFVNEVTLVFFVRVGADFGINWLGFHSNCIRNYIGDTVMMLFCRKLVVPWTRDRFWNFPHRRRGKIEEPWQPEFSWTGVPDRQNKKKNSGNLLQGFEVIKLFRGVRIVSDFSGIFFFFFFCGEVPINVWNSCVHNEVNKWI